jgi:hypothetical protein
LRLCPLQCSFEEMKNSLSFGCFGCYLCHCQNHHSRCRRKRVHQNLHPQGKRCVIGHASQACAKHTKHSSCNNGNRSVDCSELSGCAHKSIQTVCVLFISSSVNTGDITVIVIAPTISRTALLPICTLLQPFSMPSLPPPLVMQLKCLVAHHP